MLEDVTLPPLGNEKAERAIIILHGLGDSADGIIGLGQAMQRAFPGTAFSAPNAPFPCDFSPFGFQWFSMQDMSHAAILKGVQTAAPILNDYIDQVLERHHLTPDKLALVGFSQGTIMSLYVAPRRDKPVAALLGYSGALVGGESLPSERKSSPPIMLIHGTNDEVVPYVAMDHAIAGLHNVNMNATSLACPGLGHSIDDLGLAEGVKFLRRVFMI
ncbi:MAG: alpha/beta hydrolase [Bdellovibrionales bacterium]